METQNNVGKTKKAPSWAATVDLERSISIMIASIVKKHDVQIKSDFDFSKGRIVLKVNDVKKKSSAS